MAEHRLPFIFLLPPCLIALRDDWRNGGSATPTRIAAMGPADRAVVPSVCLLFSGLGIIAAGLALASISETLAAIAGLFFLVSFGSSFVLMVTTYVLARPRGLVPPSLRPEVGDRPGKPSPPAR